MPGATLATWNTNFRDPASEVEANVFQLLSTCQVAGLTEARSEGVDEALARKEWAQFQVGSDRLVWDPALWTPRGPQGQVPVHPKGPGKFLPARELAWITLEHTGSGTRHLFMFTHVTSGYASPEDLPFRAWRERAAQDHLLAIVEHSARLIALERIGFHHLLGDLNAKPARVAAWWYPVRLLDSLYVEDPEAGLDYLMHSRASRAVGLEVARRWTEALGSEGIHPAHYKRVTFPRA